MFLCNSLRQVSSRLLSENKHKVCLWWVYLKKPRTAVLPGKPVQRFLFKTSLNKTNAFSLGRCDDIRLICEKLCWKKKKKSSKLFIFAGWLHRCELLLNITVTAEWISDASGAFWKTSGAVSVVCHRWDVKDDRRQGAICSEIRRLERIQNRSAFPARGSDTPLEDFIDCDAISGSDEAEVGHTCLSSRVPWRPPACSLQQLLTQQMVDIKGKDQLGGIVLSRFGMRPATWLTGNQEPGGAACVQKKNNTGSDPRFFFPTRAAGGEWTDVLMVPDRAELIHCTQLL